MIEHPRRDARVGMKILRSAALYLSGNHSEHCALLNYCMLQIEKDIIRMYLLGRSSQSIWHEANMDCQWAIAAGFMGGTITSGDGTVKHRLYRMIPDLTNPSIRTWASMRGGSQ